MGFGPWLGIASLLWQVLAGPCITIEQNKQKIMPTKSFEINLIMHSNHSICSVEIFAGNPGSPSLSVWLQPFHAPFVFFLPSTGSLVGFWIDLRASSHMAGQVERPNPKLLSRGEDRSSLKYIIDAFLSNSKYFIEKKFSLSTRVWVSILASKVSKNVAM